MDIKYKSTLEKGKSIVIGKDTGDKMVVDGIVLHSTCVLSNNPEIITKFTLTSEDKIIYICGHGNLERQTIGGLRMHEIAHLLVKGGYKGLQDIVLTSCDSATELKIGNHTVNMASSLQCELQGLSIQCNVTSLSNGSSVIVNNTYRNNDTELWVITASDNKMDKLEMDVLTYCQAYIQKYMDAKYIDIGKETVQADIEKYRGKLQAKINKYKVDLISRELYITRSVGKLDIIVSIIILALTLGLTNLVMGGTSLLGIDMSLNTVSLVGCIIALIATIIPGFIKYTRKIIPSIILAVMKYSALLIIIATAIKG